VLADCGPVTTLGQVEEATGHVVANDRPLRQGDTVCANAKIVTKQHSRATIRLNDGSGAVVRVGPQTSAVVIPETSPSSFLVRIREGFFGFFSAEPSKLTIETPHITGAVRGTEFALTVTRAESVLTVLEGKVEASHPPTDRSVLVTAGNSIRATATSMGSPIRVQSAKFVAWSLFFPWVLRGGDQQVATLVDAQQLLAAGNSEAALDALAPGSVNSKAARVAVLLSIGEIDAALDTLQTDCIGAANSEQLDAYLLRALVAVVTDDRAIAQNCMTVATTLAPNDPMLSLVESYYEQSAGNLAEALAALPDATSNEPPTVSLRRAELFSLNGRRRDARKEAKGALARIHKSAVRGPLLAHALTIEGMVSIDSRSPRELANQFDDAISENPRDPNARRARALAAILEGDDNTTRRELQIAIALDPRAAGARTDLGRYYVRKGQPEIAKKELSYAASLDSNDPTPYHHLALNSMRVGKPAEALAYVEKSSDLSDKRKTIRSTGQLKSDRVLRGLNLSLAFRDLELSRLSWLALVRVMPDAELDSTAWSHLGSMMYESYYASARRNVRLTAKMLSSAANVNEFDYFFEPSIDSAAPTTLFESSVADFQRYSRHQDLGVLLSAFTDLDGDWSSEVVGRQKSIPWSFSIAGQASSRTSVGLSPENYDDDWRQIRTGIRRDLVGGGLLSLDIRRDRYGYEYTNQNFPGIETERSSRQEGTGEELRLGLRWPISRRSSILGVFTTNRIKDIFDSLTGFSSEPEVDTQLFDLQYRYQNSRVSIVTGMRDLNQSRDLGEENFLFSCGGGNDPDDTSISSSPCAGPDTAGQPTGIPSIPVTGTGNANTPTMLDVVKPIDSGTRNANVSSAYFDTTVTLSPTTHLLAGLTYENPGPSKKMWRWLPRLGLMWNERKQNTITTARAVAYRHQSLPQFSPATLKPGIMFGFVDQLVVPGRTQIEGAGLALDRQWGTRLGFGISVDHRMRVLGDVDPLRENRTQLSVISDWRPTDKLSFSILASSIRFERPEYEDTYLRTHRLLATARYRHDSAFSTNITLSSTWQRGNSVADKEFVNLNAPVVMNVAIKYQHPRNRFVAALGGNNVSGRTYAVYSLDRDTPSNRTGRKYFAWFSWSL